MKTRPALCFVSCHCVLLFDVFIPSTSALTSHCARCGYFQHLPGISRRASCHFAKKNDACRFPLGLFYVQSNTSARPYRWHCRKQTGRRGTRLTRCQRELPLLPLPSSLSSPFLWEISPETRYPRRGAPTVAGNIPSETSDSGRKYTFRNQRQWPEIYLQISRQ